MKIFSFKNFAILGMALLAIHARAGTVEFESTAKLCLQGRFSIQGASDTKAEMRFHLEGSSLRPTYFSTEILNPDQAFETNKKVLKVSEAFRPDSKIELFAAQGLKCPCSIFRNSSGRLQIEQEYLADGSQSFKINYFGFNTHVLELESCQ